VKVRSARLLAVGVWVILAGCGGEKGPPRHPVAEMTARSTAKLELIDLVVSDPSRAQRLHALYLEVATVARDFDLARARSMLRAQDEWQRRTTAEGQEPPASEEMLELLLAPPIAVGKAAFERYTALMLEARSLLREDEFETLNGVR